MDIFVAIVLFIVGISLVLSLGYALSKKKTAERMVVNLTRDKFQIGTAVNSAVQSLKGIEEVTDKPPEWTRDRSLAALKVLEGVLPEFEKTRV